MWGSRVENSIFLIICDFFLGGVKMRYPSCYVLVTDLDDSTAELYKNHSTNQTNPQQQQQPQQHQQQQQQSKYFIYLKKINYSNVFYQT